MCSSASTGLSVYKKVVEEELEIKGTDINNALSRFHNHLGSLLDEKSEQIETYRASDLIYVLDEGTGEHKLINIMKFGSKI